MQICKKCAIVLCENKRIYRGENMINSRWPICDIFKSGRTKLYIEPLTDNSGLGTSDLSMDVEG